MKLSLLFEDDFLFAVEKPALLHSVGLPNGGGGDSLADLLIQKWPIVKQASLKPEDGGLIQRLDFETSGVILGAKDRASWEALFAALKDGGIRKEYLVLVEKELKRRFVVQGWIGSPARSAKKMRVYSAEPSKEARALPAHSEFVPEQYFPDIDATLCRVLCPTARRHQIRAHAGSIGHPLVGDTVYGSTKTFPGADMPPFLLHAALVELKHPKTGEMVKVESAIPFKIHAG